MPDSIFDASPVASLRAETLHIVCDAWVDAGALERLRAESGRDDPAARAFAVGSGAARSRMAWTSRLWWRRPGYWRDDVEMNGGMVVTVLTAREQLVYVSAERRVYSNRGPRSLLQRISNRDEGRLPTIQRRIDGFVLLNPRLNSSDWSFADAGGAQHLGRSVKVVHATRRISAAQVSDDQAGPWPGVRLYECFVDESLGLVTAIRAMADGAVVAEYTAVELEVDRGISDGIFNFALPAGSELVYRAEADENFRK